MSERAFSDGETIPGTRYRVVRLVGQGGMGNVYEVEHVELGKRFVLKALLSDLAARPDLVVRLRNEWRALGRLEHPNIVSVTDAGTTRTGVPYFVMERLEGDTLSQRLRRDRRLSLLQACGIADDVAAGLGAAHEIGIVHRDVKPPNIFLPQRGPAKLLDFGIAKIASSSEALTASGVALGTPRYMSPEQARGETVDARADLYAVGLILFEMLAGCGPFDPARDANELLLGHLARRPALLREWVPAVPEEIEGLVARLLAKRVDERPASAQEVRAVLGPFLPPSSPTSVSCHGPANGDADDDAPTRVVATARLQTAPNASFELSFGKPGSKGGAATGFEPEGAAKTQPLAPAVPDPGPMGTVRDAEEPPPPPGIAPPGNARTVRLPGPNDVVATRTAIPSSRSASSATPPPIAALPADDRQPRPMGRDVVVAASVFLSVAVLGLAMVGLWSAFSPLPEGDRAGSAGFEGSSRHHAEPVATSVRSAASPPASFAPLPERVAVAKRATSAASGPSAAAEPPPAPSARLSPLAPSARPVPHRVSSPRWRAPAEASAPAVRLPASGL